MFRPDIFRLLLGYLDVISPPIIKSVAASGSVEDVQYLMKRGADPNLENMLLEAVFHHNYNHRGTVEMNSNLNANFVNIQYRVIFLNPSRT